jgi:hypothetical protein
MELLDGTPLFEKLMNHFGWYKTKKVDMVVENLDVHYVFQIKDETPEIPFPAPKAKSKPALKKATTRKTAKNGN